MSTHRRRRHVEDLGANAHALLGLFSLGIIAVLSTIGLKAAFGAYDSGYELVGRFEGAGQNLDTESVIKLRGVDVGRVEGIRLDEDNRAEVRMHIDSDVQVPETAVAVIRPISIFGPKYIDLIPGVGESDGPFYEPGDEIAQTRPSLELGEILGEAAQLLEAVEPADVTTILHTLADGVDGLDAEMADSLTNGQVVLDAMINSSDDRNELLGNLAVLAEELADDGETIIAIGENVHEGLPVLTEQEGDFAGLLEATSRLSSDLGDILDANRATLGPGIDAGARLSDITANDLRGVVSYLDFVNTYGDVLSQVIRVPVVGEAFLMATQQFLMGSDLCTFLVVVPGCEMPPIDPGPAAAGR